MLPIKIFVIIMWIVLFFLGNLFNVHLLLLLTLLLVTLCLIFLRKSPQKTTIFLSLASIAIILLIWERRFEEDYCWQKTKEMESTGIQTITATKADAALFDVEEGVEVGVGYLAHMRCHREFNIGKTHEIYLTLFEKYFVR